MSKVVKITKSQISTLINEEVKKYKKVKELENRKVEIMSQLNEMYEPQEIDEILGLGSNPAKEQALVDAKGKEYDAAAQAWIAGLQAKNPNLNLALYQQAVAANKQAAVANAVKRGKEMGAKPGKFIFLTKGGKLIVQYEQGNIIPATGLGAGNAGTMGSGFAGE